jgi:hypothetical protein
MCDDDDPRPDKLSPALRTWVEKAPEEERRTVVVRTRAASALADPDGPAVAEIEATGSEIESAGAGGATVVVSPRSLADLARLDWVKAVDEPRRLDPATLSRRPPG